MKKLLNTVLTIGLLCPIAVFAAENATSQNSTAVAPDSVHIRSLAASCAACHGTDGKAAAESGAAVLAGMDKNQLNSKLMAFKAGTVNATVMHRHAKGLTDDEIQALAVYFSSQSAAAAPKLKPQKLRADHAH